MQYFDLEKKSNDCVFDYFLSNIVQARIDIGIRSNMLDLDEDANVYLAGLLHRYTDPEFIQRSRKYVKIYESDIAEINTDREAYYTYRNTADYITVMIGIFDGLGVDDIDDEVYAGRGR